MKIIVYMKRIGLLIIISLFVLGISCSKKEGDNTNIEKDELALLDVKIRKEPKNAELLYARSIVLMEMGKLSESIIDVQKAISMSPKEYKYYIQKAKALYYSGETTVAFSTLQEAEKIDPKNTEAFILAAEIALVLKDYDKTIFNINEALKLDKLDADAYYLRGRAMKEMGDTINSVKSYMKAVELRADFEEAFEELGLLYATININPNNYHAMYALALFYQDNGIMQKALDTYYDIINIKPDHADALHNVGYINLVYKESYEDALSLFDKAIESEPDFYQAYYNRGVTYELMGEREKAEKDFEKVLEINPVHRLAKEKLRKP